MARDGSTAFYLESLPGDPGSAADPVQQHPAVPADEGRAERLQLRRAPAGAAADVRPAAVRPRAPSADADRCVDRPGRQAGPDRPHRAARGHDAPGAAHHGSQRAQRRDRAARRAHDRHGCGRRLVGDRRAAAAAAGVLRGHHAGTSGPRAVAGRQAQGRRDPDAQGHAAGRRLGDRSAAPSTRRSPGGSCASSGGSRTRASPRSSPRPVCRGTGRPSRSPGTATPAPSYFAELPENPFDGQDGDATITGNEPGRRHARELSALGRHSADRPGAVARSARLPP